MAQKKDKKPAKRTIVLLTDFGLKDDFVGVMKGIIFGINPTVNVIDLCHNILPQSIREAGFLLERSYKYFPPGTIFLTVVDPGVGTKRKIIIVKTADYYFVVPDNGILSFLEQKEIKNIIEVTNKKYFIKPVSNTFHGRDIFSPVAAYLSCGEKITNFGGKINEIKRLDLDSVISRDNDCISSEIIYIDHFGNAVTNIKKKIFDGFIKGQNIEIKIKNKKIDKISSSYEDYKTLLEPIAIFGSSNNLEISLPFASAAEQFEIKRGDKIYINLKEKSSL